ncbi:hypothetical protein AAFF_G00327760 [Aldrovandia affinis]|uniref:Uncharacterized protein n=1 Tax=Aldrovandia affinis TaxID=143900 RepID=A0AAD7TAN6_9TELE|nr:hypothetical protein AAFF_G00327760 [Aldrovandia affinis]
MQYFCQRWKQRRVGQWSETAAEANATEEQCGMHCTAAGPSRTPLPGRPHAGVLYRHSPARPSVPSEHCFIKRGDATRRPCARRGRGLPRRRSGAMPPNLADRGAD